MFIIFDLSIIIELEYVFWKEDFLLMANVSVLTENMKSASSFVNKTFSDCSDSYMSINVGKCTALNAFKNSLDKRMVTFENHSNTFTNKLEECAINLEDIDNLIGSNVTNLLASADSFEFTTISSVITLDSPNISNLSSLDGLNIEPGVHVLEYTISTGQTMQYVVRVPEGATENMPVIFWVHGANQGNANRVQNMGPIKAAEELEENRFIIVEPVFTRYLMSTYTNDDINALDTFMDEIQQVYKFDPDRVILSGFSMGGAGTWYLGNQNPEKYAGIAPASYAPNDIDISNLMNSDVPIYAMAGGAEANFCQKNEAIVEEMKEINPDRECESISVGNLGHYNFFSDGYTQDFFDWCYKQNRKNYVKKSA